MKRAGLILLAASLLYAGSDFGIRPRASSADYPAHQTVGGTAIGAAAMPADQVKKLFLSDLNHAGYVVVEVSIYPEAGKEINVSPGDFLLRTVAEDSKMVRPATPEVIAAAYERKTPPPQPGSRSDISVTQTAEVGYGSGTDPVTGRRESGTYGATGVAVSRGGDSVTPPPPPPVSPGRDPVAIEQELTGKSLPDGKTSEAVAGYLYFPRPSKKKNEALALIWYAPGGNVTLSLPPAGK